MAELKTRPSGEDVAGFLEKIPDPSRKVDAIALRELMASVTGEPGQMWGDAIVASFPVIFATKAAVNSTGSPMASLPGSRT